MIYTNERKEICDIARIMFDRKLTNAAGGNISIKINDSIFLMTPTLMAEHKHCRMKPEDILVIDADLNILEGEGKLTRESNMHVGVYKNLPLAQSVVHAHPQYAMFFACSGVALPSMTEATDIFGDIITLPFRKACTQELADMVVQNFVERKHELESHALVALLRKHGIIIADKTLEKAYCVLERIETNAFVNIIARLYNQPSIS